MNLGRRIELLLEQKGWLQRDLLDRVPDLEAATLSALIRRDSKRSDAAPEIARALGVSLEYLLGRTDDPAPRDNAAGATLENAHVILENGELSFSQVPRLAPTNKVPFIKALGEARDLGGSEAATSRDGAVEFYEVSHYVSSKAIAYRMIGHYLSPMFPQGTIVLFDPERPAKDGFPVLVDVGGDVKIRLYRILFQDVFELYTPLPSHGVIRSDQAPVKVLMGFAGAFIDPDAS